MKHQDTGFLSRWAYPSQWPAGAPHWCSALCAFTVNSLSNQLCYPGSYKFVTRTGAKFWLGSQENCIERLLEKDRCFGLSLENIATTTFIARIKKFGKFSIPLVQPSWKTNCLFINSLYKIVLSERQIEKRVVWLQFSDLLLLSPTAGGMLPLLPLKTKLSQACLLPFLTSWLLSTPGAHTAVSGLWPNFGVYTKSLKRPLGHKDPIFAEGYQANY